MIPGFLEGIVMGSDTPRKFGTFTITGVEEGSPNKVFINQPPQASSLGVTLHHVDGGNQILAILPEDSSAANPGACTLSFLIENEDLKFQPFAGTVYKPGDTLGVVISRESDKSLVVTFVGSGEIHYTVAFNLNHNGRSVSIDDPTVILRPPTEPDLRAELS